MHTVFIIELWCDPYDDVRIDASGEGERFTKMIMIRSSELIFDYDIPAIVNHLGENIDVVSPNTLLTCNNF